MASTDARVVYMAQGRFEAPNWTRDNMLVFNGASHLYRIPADGGTPVAIDTGFATRVNNDHGISPDGTMLAISDNSQDDHKSQVYVVPIGAARRAASRRSRRPTGMAGRRTERRWPSAGQRNGNFDVYTIPAAGGEETRLTTAKGLDDGPEYSPDGKYIYFNSERTGHMQIWRMKPDGSEQEQVISDDLNNWFPHISPDGQRMVFVTYERGRHWASGK